MRIVLASCLVRGASTTIVMLPLSRMTMALWIIALRVTVSHRSHSRGLCVAGQRRAVVPCTMGTARAVPPGGASWRCPSAGVFRAAAGRPSNRPGRDRRETRFPDHLVPDDFRPGEPEQVGAASRSPKTHGSCRDLQNLPKQR